MRGTCLLVLNLSVEAAAGMGLELVWLLDLPLYILWCGQDMNTFVGVYSGLNGVTFCLKCSLPGS